MVSRSLKLWIGQIAMSCEVYYCFAMLRWFRPSIRRCHRSEHSTIAPTMKRGDGPVCVNDRVAGHVLHALLALGYRIPHDLRMVRIDDVEYASLLPIPLPTVINGVAKSAKPQRQVCLIIGSPGQICSHETSCLNASYWSALLAGESG